MNNLLDAWRYACGQSEVPDEFFTFSCLSLIGACCTDMIWFEKFAGSKLLPNLFVGLVGPSGLGKGVAISKVSKLAVGSEAQPTRLPEINAFVIKATVQHILDIMAEITKTNKKLETNRGTCVYIIMPELAANIGHGPQARDFATVMTHLWDGSEVLNTEGTRWKGSITISRPVPNLLFGTTEEWLMASLPRDAIEGGFIARTILVEGRYNFERRYYRPEVPTDAQAVWEYIAERLVEILGREGGMIMTHEAEAIDQLWYMGRESPTNMQMAPIWKRQQDLIIKLAMALSLCDSTSGIIDGHHMEQAQQLMDRCVRSLPKLMVTMNATRETHLVGKAMEHIKKYGSLDRSRLIKYLYNLGCNSTTFDREVLPHMLASGCVDSGSSKTGATIYTWRARRVIE